MSYINNLSEHSPITIILGAARLLKNTKLSVQQRDYLNDILYAAEQLSNHASASSMPKKNTKKPKRVLVVEDVLIIQQFTKNAVLELGCEVDAADSVAQALAQVDNDYDVLLLDIALPDGRGTDVARAFRAHLKHQNTHMIAITAFESKEVKAECLAAGINDFYTKPVFPKQIKKIVSEHFAKKAVAAC